MINFGVLCLCISLILATSTSKQGASKIAPRKLPGERIFHGNPASPGQFPYQALVFIFDGYGGDWYCGGSIINEEWILTAAHCLVGGFSALVIVDTVDLLHGHGNYSYELIPHEDYDDEQLANDIGLIRLSQPLSFGGGIQAIPLDSQPVGDGEVVIVTGWGATSDASLSSDVLNYIHLITMSNAECEEFYGEGLIREEMICATSNNSQIKSTCSGDSGGPLVIGEGDQTVQVAVVSFVSDSGCESGAPSGYTRVAPYIDWIQSHIGKE